MLDSEERTHDKNSKVPADLVEPADMEEQPWELSKPSVTTIEGRYARLESPQQDTDVGSAEPMDVDEDTSPETQEMIAWDVVGWKGAGEKNPDFGFRLVNR